MICKENGLTYKEYLESPDWFITALDTIGDINAKYDKQEAEKLKNKK